MTFAWLQLSVLFHSLIDDETNEGRLWSWSYGSWIYDYLCNHCQSPLTLWVRIPLMARCTWYNILWWRLSVAYDRLVVFSGFFGFLHQYNRQQPDNWNAVEKGVKYYNRYPEKMNEESWMKVYKTVLIDLCHCVVAALLFFM